MNKSKEWLGKIDAQCKSIQGEKKLRKANINFNKLVTLLGLHAKFRRDLKESLEMT